MPGEQRRLPAKDFERADGYKWELQDGAIINGLISEELGLFHPL